MFHGFRLAFIEFAPLGSWGFRDEGLGFRDLGTRDVGFRAAPLGFLLRDSRGLHWPI